MKEKLFKDIEIGEKFYFTIWTGDVWEFIKTDKYHAKHNIENSYANNFPFDWNDKVIQ